VANITKYLLNFFFVRIQTSELTNYLNFRALVFGWISQEMCCERILSSHYLPANDDFALILSSFYTPEQGKPAEIHDPKLDLPECASRIVAHVQALFLN